MPLFVDGFAVTIQATCGVDYPAAIVEQVSKAARREWTWLTTIQATIPRGSPLPNA